MRAFVSPRVRALPGRGLPPASAPPSEPEGETVGRRLEERMAALLRFLTASGLAVLIVLFWLGVARGVLRLLEGIERFFRHEEERVRNWRASDHETDRTQ